MLKKYKKIFTLNTLLFNTVLGSHINDVFSDEEKGKFLQKLFIHNYAKFIFS